jgi:hypothetical protein
MSDTRFVRTDPGWYVRFYADPTAPQYGTETYAPVIYWLEPADLVAGIAAGHEIGAIILDVISGAPPGTLVDADDVELDCTDYAGYDLAYLPGGWWKREGCDEHGVTNPESYVTLSGMLGELPHVRVSGEVTANCHDADPPRRR